MLSRKENNTVKFSKFMVNKSLYITNTGYISRAVYNQFPSLSNILYMTGKYGYSSMYRARYSFKYKKKCR